MQSFIRTIKLDDKLTDLFFSFLLNERYQVPPLRKDQQHLISYITASFFMSGFLLKSSDFNIGHKNLVEQLKYQRRIQLLKQMSVENDLKNVARSLNEKGIKHVALKGFALNLDGIYQRGIRFSRDVDLLISLDMLQEVYDLLKTLGFKYLDKSTKDSAAYHSYGHHLPPMINENKTKLELHWRVTPPRDFKKCPLTENILANIQVSKINNDIFCPKIETTLAHLVYHGLVHHRMILGPIFLFDLASIYRSYNENWPVDTKLLKTLGVYDQFNSCKELIELASRERDFSGKSKKIIQQLLDDSFWLRLSDESEVPEFSTKYHQVKEDNIFLKLIIKGKEIKHRHQVSYLSLDFWLLLISNVFRVLKKVMKRHKA